VQATHAGIAAAKAGIIPSSGPQPSLVVLGIPNERELIAFRDHCTQAGIKCATFREEDLNSEYTALATEPLENGKRRVFREYKLLE
jgi:hypothetical protein